MMQFLTPGFLCCRYPLHRATDKHTQKEHMFVHFSTVWECLIPCNQTLPALGSGYRGWPWVWGAVFVFPSDKPIKPHSSERLRLSIDHLPRENSLVHPELVLAPIVSTQWVGTVVSPFLLPAEGELSPSHGEEQRAPSLPPALPSAVGRATLSAGCWQLLMTSFTAIFTEL